MGAHPDARPGTTGTALLRTPAVPAPAAKAVGSAMNPLIHLDQADFEVLSNVARRRLDAHSVVLPLLAAQIGLDRRSRALGQAEALSAGYFTSLADRYRESGLLSVGVLREIDRAIAYLLTSGAGSTAAGASTAGIPTSQALTPAVVGSQR